MDLIYVEQGINKFLNVKHGSEELEGKLTLKCNQEHKHICFCLEPNIKLVSAYEKKKSCCYIMPTYLLVCQHEARTFLCLNKAKTFLADSVHIYDMKTAGIKSSTH